MGEIRTFLETHFLHFNSRELVAAARAWEAHLARGGKMLVSLAGAMSTARIGKLLSELIRRDMVHAISCTGANLEEDVFSLLARESYETIADWRALRAEDEQALYDRGMNRVTDTCIPETVMRDLEARLRSRWRRAAERGEVKMPVEFLHEVLDDPGLVAKFQAPPEESWVLTTRAAGIPVFTPGWEDSTTGNLFAAAVWSAEVPSHGCVASGTVQFERVMRWYLEQPRDPAPGFFQIGGGIAGDFAICAVPCLIQDLRREDVPAWGYFAQISDAVTSYGGYSGAVPNEKITWGKLRPQTPKFMIQSDATIVAPLIFAHLLDL
ncbi:MAG TPA: deoxyhypusine synthase family protein [Myxococcales bacterium LLY-WYZ-16_1]|jgi:deoxyhypusine synthase|nr:deoxyhypusine synthase family protein [Myxococcales bacterium LLY-WYZ-16_1]